MFVYLFVLPHPQKKTIKFYKQASVLHLHTGKLWLEGRFFFPVKSQVCRLATNFKSCFPSGLFWCSTTENTGVDFLGAYLVTSKFGVTGQPRGYPRIII